MSWDDAVELTHPCAEIEILPRILTIVCASLAGHRAAGGVGVSLRLSHKN